MNRSSAVRLGAAVFAVATPLLLYRAAVAPYAWIGLTWAGICLFLFRTSTGAKTKMLWANLTAACLAFSLVEGYLWTRPDKPSKPPIRATGTYTKGQLYFTNNHPFLGYAPLPGVSVTSAKELNGQLLYDVVYTIGKDGLRVSPPVKDATVGCVLFFGDSFTFGEGVNDQETIPYQLGILSSGAYRVYNLGFHGYGPHQMLSAIEHGFVKNKIECDEKMPLYVIYQTLPDHIARAAGLSAWDPHGPRYQIKGGRVLYTGHFDDGIRLPKRLSQALQKSKIYQMAVERPRPPSDGDLQRYLAIVARAKRELKQLNANTYFYVILWYDLPNELGKKSTRMLDALRGNGIEALRVDDILPEYEARIKAYHIPHDGHPTAETCKLIAKYISEHLLQRSDLRDVGPP